MSSYIKHGIEEIKSTKRYAREKNVNGWYINLIGAVIVSFFAATTFFLLSIVFFNTVNPNHLIIKLLDSLSYGIFALPIILTFVIMMSIGKYLIKSMIYFTYLIQQLMMIGINRLDMYLWKKTGKDSLASNFIVKHKKIVQFMMFTPLILFEVLRHHIK